MFSNAQYTDVLLHLCILKRHQRKVHRRKISVLKIQFKIPNPEVHLSQRNEIESCKELFKRQISFGFCLFVFLLFKLRVLNVLSITTGHMTGISPKHKTGASDNITLAFQLIGILCSAL